MWMFLHRNLISHISFELQIRCIRVLCWSRMSGGSRPDNFFSAALTFLLSSHFRWLWSNLRINLDLLLLLSTPTLTFRWGGNFGSQPWWESNLNWLRKYQHCRRFVWWPLRWGELRRFCWLIGILGAEFIGEGQWGHWICRVVLVWVGRRWSWYCRREVQHFWRTMCANVRGRLDAVPWGWSGWVLCWGRCGQENWRIKCGGRQLLPIWRIVDP